MGVQLGDLVVKEKIDLAMLARRQVAIDAYNALYQFLSIIRQRDGTPLMDGRGRVTSHLSGIFYRTARLLEAGVRPVYIFDGKPPVLKRGTVQERIHVREEAKERWQRAKAAGELEEARKYAQASSRLTKEMVEESKRLLKAMGLPIVDAPSEGEAQAAWMAREGKVDLCSSQDYDALLFGAPQLVRNLTLSGRRKLPGKNVYVEVEPELIDLNKTLKELGIERRQLVWIGILVGTDFNEGVKGIGPKKALKLVKGAESLSDVVKASGGEFEVEPAEVEKFFMHPPVDKNAKVEFGEPDKREMMDFLCKEHDFSEARVAGIADAIAKRAGEKGEQSSLGQWVG